MHTRTGYVRSNGVNLHVEVAGKGPPVVLLHGFPENGFSWQHQVDALVRAGRSVWVPNLRGYPPSAVPRRRSDYHLRRLVADVEAVVRATGERQATVVGHDWGGIIAWSFAGLRPELLDRLVILNAPHMQIYLDKLGRSSQLFRSLYVALFQLPWAPERILAARNFFLVRKMFTTLPARPATFSDADIQHYVDALAQPGALKAALDYYRENMRAGGLELARAARTEAPVLVIWGEKDPALGTFLLDGLERFAPNLRIQRIPGASHWVQNEAPDEVNNALLAFLAAPAASRPSQAGHA